MSSAVVNKWLADVYHLQRHAAEKPGGSATFAEQENHNALAKAIAAAAAAAGAPAPTFKGTSNR
jgi:hypothetical protein